jgi:hypothetical protein
MSDELEVLEESGYGLTEILFRNLPEETVEKAKNLLNKDIRRFSPDSNRAPPH